MRRSRAFKAFTGLLSVSETLLKMESRIPFPVAANRAKQSHGLRGGSIVLMVAAFETYLQSAFEEQVDRLNDRRDRIDVTLLVEDVWLHSVFESLDRSTKSSPSNPLPPKRDRLRNVLSACRSITDGYLDGKALSRTQGNPNSECVKQLFRRVGVSHPFESMKQPFEALPGTGPVAETFIPDKLDEIINRRNSVAHNADVQNIARTDLALYVSFLRSLATVVDDQLAQRVRDIERTCPRRVVR
jgi:hypothetical protein